ncbi:MAG: acyl carrier protein [Acidobacteria bacterium]|nr:acyl carrier protein [Acidobacteriota bacterium]
MDNLLSRLEEVFRLVFDDDALVLRDDMSAKDVEDWDSLQHINLVIAVEKRFSIRFATAEISRLKEPGQNIGSFRRLLEEKLTAKA